MSTSNKTLIVKCPNCGCSVLWTPEQVSKPFCSERCKLIDLGEWAMEEKTIPGESLSLDDYSNDDIVADDDHFFH
ncbi:MAG: DNA gyrase inhibitor YacG [Methylobacter sp.]|nr:DNA gyrase inhibitor YacG [Candidatus Methylobacter titanis]